MEFKSNKGIFQQIADSICDRILSGEFKPGDKVPSVRELAGLLGVNHNTIMRTFIELQHANIVENRRGIGYYVTESAPKMIQNQRKAEFFETELPSFVELVKLLDIRSEELKPLFDQLEIRNHETN